MPLTSGSLSTRVWRVAETLPQQFTELFERNLRRYAFTPPNPEKGELRSMGWVNIRQVLDARPTLKKCQFGNVIALGLRVDRITINQKLFRATLAQDIAEAVRNRDRAKGKITREERAALEDQVRMKLLKAQSPSMAIYEMAWELERGIVFLSTTGDKLNVEFSDLFTQTFGVALDPQFPFLRAERWAKRQRQEKELLELLPAPFSPRAPAEVVEVESREE